MSEVFASHLAGMVQVKPGTAEKGEWVKELLKPTRTHFTEVIFKRVGEKMLKSEKKI